MINVNKIRKDFPMLQNKTQQGHPLVYLDNAATTFKPQCVIDACNSYYLNENANSHRGDYDLAFKVDTKVDEVRTKVANFINAEKQEIVFTSGTSMSLNMIAFGYGFKFLKEGDEILLSEAEHASNVLPWFKVAELTKATIKYIPLTKEGRLTIENFKKTITKHTKVVSLASVSNVRGYSLPVKELVSLAHSAGALYVDDAAQSAPHRKIDVKDLDVDFLAFSGHKRCGPTGIGILYGKKNLLEKISPTFYGGERNARFNSKGEVLLDDLPYRREAGTQNVAGALGLAKACEYLSSVGFDNIHEHERKLRKLAIEGLKKNGNAILYNEDADSGIITFNIKDVFPQDVASYLSSKGVFVRSGQHCAKILPEILKAPGTVRASIYRYNTEDDIKALIKACSTAEDFLDAFFH